MLATTAIMSTPTTENARASVAERERSRGGCTVADATTRADATFGLGTRRGRGAILAGQG